MFRILLSFFHVFSIFIFPSHAITTIHFSHIDRPAVTSTPTSIVTPTITLMPTTIPNPIESGPTIEVTPTATPTQLLTPTLTLTPTSLATPTPTPTPTLTVTPTLTITPTDIPTPLLTLTSTPIVTPSPSLTDTPTTSPTPTVKLTPTIDQTPTLTPTPTELEPTTEVTPTATPTLTPTPTEVPTKIGNDISYPQCGKTLPVNQEFGIVGVNDGIATTTNPCMGSELLWAVLSSGTANQAKIQLYVNTGNPGGLNTASWPTNNVDPLGNGAPNPDGTCDGSDSTACAWQYGWNRAVDDVQNKFIPAAQSVGMVVDPTSYPWWLDVETVNSWESGSDAALQRNEADLEAMVSYFESKGITVGIYSTSHQWGEIVGTVPSGSNLNGLHSWLPGASDLAGAQANCTSPALTVGGSVTMTQYTIDPFDYDYSCI